MTTTAAVANASTATSTATTANQMKRKYKEGDDAGDNKEPPMPAKNGTGMIKAAVSAFDKVVPSSQATLTSSTHPKLVGNAPANANNKHNDKSSLLAPPSGGGVGVGGQTLLDESYFSPTFVENLMKEMALKQEQFLHKTQMLELYRVSYEHATCVASRLLSQASIMKTTKESEAVNQRLLTSYMAVLQNLEACNAFAMAEAGFIEREYQGLATIQNLLRSVAEGRAIKRKATLVTTKTSDVTNHYHVPLRLGDAAMSPGGDTAVDPPASMDIIKPSPIKKAKTVALDERSVNVGQAECGRGGTSGGEKESAKTTAKSGSGADQHVTHM